MRNYGQRNWAGSSKLTRGLTIDKFPSSAAFDAINSALTASDADRKDAVKQGGAIFGFTLKNAGGETESWHIDLKEKGEVMKGLPEKPTGMLHPPFSTAPYRFSLACLHSHSLGESCPCYICHCIVEL